MIRTFPARSVVGWLVVMTAGLFFLVSSASASIIQFQYVGTGAAAGLSARAVFELEDSNTLVICLTNTSSMPPSGADQVLSSLNFDLGGVEITGGMVQLFGMDSMVVSASSGNWVDAGYFDDPENDLNDEYGYSNEGVGNEGSNGAILSGITAGEIDSMLNSAVTSHTNGGQKVTTFNGDTGLPGGLDFGLVNGNNAFGNKLFIRNGIKLTLILGDDGLSDLSFLDAGSYVEYGSDYAYVGGEESPTGMNPIPEPTSLATWSIICLVALQRNGRRRRRLV